VGVYVPGGGGQSGVATFPLHDTAATAGTTEYQTNVVGDSIQRIMISADGTHTWANPSFTLGTLTPNGTIQGLTFQSNLNHDLLQINMGDNPVRFPYGLTLGHDGTSNPIQVYGGTGAPNIPNSSADAYYFRTDTPGTANQRIYIATAANTWVGIV